MLRAIVLPLLSGIVVSALSLVSGAAQQSNAPSASRTAFAPLPDKGENPTVLTGYPSEAFLGTWEWRAGDDVFRMTLVRELHYPLPKGQSAHYILGRHSYSRNGVLVEESYSRTPSPDRPTGCSLMGTPIYDWRLMMGFIDLTKHKLGNVLLTLDPNCPDELHFTVQKEMHGAYTNGQSPTPGFTVPTSMVLTRQ